MAKHRQREIHGGVQDTVKDVRERLGDDRRPRLKLHPDGHRGRREGHVPGRWCHRRDVVRDPGDEDRR